MKKHFFVLILLLVMAFLFTGYVFAVPETINLGDVKIPESQPGVYYIKFKKPLKKINSLVTLHNWNTTIQYDQQTLTDGILKIAPTFSCSDDISVTTEDKTITAHVEIYEPENIFTIAFSDNKIQTENINLNVGETYNISATANPYSPKNNFYSYKINNWEVLNDHIAEVDSKGKITAIGPGETYVYGYTKDNELSALCKVVVKSTDMSLILNITKTTIEQYQSFSLSANITPNIMKQNVYYVSKNKDIAIVDRKTGVVTGVGVGQAEIEAVSEYYKISEKCIVNVTEYKENEKEISDVYNYCIDDVLCDWNDLAPKWYYINKNSEVYSGDGSFIADNVYYEAGGNSDDFIKKYFFINGINGYFYRDKHYHDDIDPDILFDPKIRVSEGYGRYVAKKYIAENPGKIIKVKIYKNYEPVITIDNKDRYVYRYDGNTRYMIFVNRKLKYESEFYIYPNGYGVFYFDSIKYNKDDEIIIVVDYNCLDGDCYKYPGILGYSDLTFVSKEFEKSYYDYNSVNFNDVYFLEKDFKNAASSIELVPIGLIVNENLAKDVVFAVSEKIIETGDIVAIYAQTDPVGSEKSIEWSSSDENYQNKIIFLDYGVINGLRPGTVTVTGNVTDESGKEHQAYCTVTVKPAISGISFENDKITLKEGQAENLAVNIFPADAIKDNVFFRTDSDNIIVDVHTGKVVGIKPGTAKVTAYSFNNPAVSAECEVTVIERVKSLKLNKESAFIYKGDTLQLFASVFPDTLKNEKIIWITEDPNVATVDGNGKVYGINDGKTNIIARAESDCGVFAKCAIEVGDYVKSAKIDPANISLAQGTNAVLKPIMTPENGRFLDWSWSSSNNTIVTVTYSKDRTTANIHAVAAGKADIVLTVKTPVKNISAKCTVTVTKTIKVTKITLNKTSGTLAKGKTATLTATVSPSNATNKGIIWKSKDETIATVDSKGNVKGIKAGSTVIRALSAENSKIYADCKVTVKDPTVPVTGVELDRIDITVNVGDITALKATVKPSNATNKDVEWKSSNTNIVKVNAKGEFKAYKAGKATVSVRTKDGKFIASCKVTVKDPTVPVTGVELDKTSITVNVGDITALKATVKPTNATNKDVEWKSSNTSIVKVNSKGEFKAYKAGKATVSVRTKDGKFVASCKVTVKDKTVPVTGVKLDRTSVTASVGEIVALHATVLPENATDKNVTWKSSNTNIVKVNSKGEFKTYKKGTATITVTTKDGSRTATCKVTVK